MTEQNKVSETRSQDADQDARSQQEPLTQRPWVTPTFERTDLKGALTGTFNITANDGTQFSS